MENKTIDLPMEGLAKLNVAINHNRSSKLAKLPKKMLVKIAAATLVLTASAVSGPSLAASTQNTQLWLSSTLRHEDTENRYVSILKSNLNFAVFNDVSSRHISDDEQLNYTKAVVMALIRWVFGERSEREGNDAHVDVQKWLSILRALHNSGTPN